VPLTYLLFIFLQFKQGQKLLVARVIFVVIVAIIGRAQVILDCLPDECRIFGARGQVVQLGVSLVRGIDRI
jgi:hypothetical protein